MDNGIFIQLSLSKRVGSAGRLLNLYLKTIGRSKVGFSMDDKTVFGRPSFVKGQIGAAERNVVRYMLALEITLTRPDSQFQDRAAAWFDATERYPRQLRELDRDDYLRYKQKEFQNQVMMQKNADEGRLTVYQEVILNR